MKVQQPVIDARKNSDLLRMLRDMVPHFTHEWPASDESDPGVALLKIFSQMTESVITRFNQKPRKNFVAFLDMLGIKLLPAQSARAPLTFKLANGTEKDILISARTQAAADKTEEHDELIFETEKNLLATISNLQEVISVDPFKDAIYVHTPNVLSKDGEILDKQTAFTLFSGVNQQEHSIYLGHKDLFNIEGQGEIDIEIALAAGGSGDSGLKFKWEYWGEDKINEKDDWIPLDIMSDETAEFTNPGMITLLKTSEGKVKEEKLGEIFKKTSRGEIKSKELKEKKNRWLRCVLSTPLTTPLRLRLPALQTVFIRTSSQPGEELIPDAGSFNDVPLIMPPPIKNGNSTISVPRTAIMTATEASTPIFPFGTRPRLYDVFYIASQEAFSKKRATITLKLSLSVKVTGNPKPSPEPTLSWEYWNGKGWESLVVNPSTTKPGIEKNQLKNFLIQRSDLFVETADDSDDAIEGDIQFVCPEDFEETEVNGQKNYWIRAKLANGDYGRDEVDVVKSSDGIITDIKVVPRYVVPVVNSLGITYKFTKNEPLQSCLTYNNLDFQDVSLQSRKTDQPIAPFVQMLDTTRNFYLGFDQQLAGGPIRIFFDAKELDFKEATKPKLDWNYQRKDSWSALDYLDETEAFITQGHLDLIGPSDFTVFSLFGQSLYWLQASHVKGEFEVSPEIRGIYPNTTWAIQSETIKDEILGSSDGEPDQTFTFLKSSVIEGEEIRVRETPSEEEKQNLISTLGEEGVREFKDEKGKVLETWILWSEVPDFFESKPADRHYTLDRALGDIQFGNGKNGMIPSAGDDNIKAFLYRAGGSDQGNVKAREIKSLKSSVGGVEKVSNPVAADGGANSATLDEMLEIGPAIISSGYRAVTAEDFEWLTRMASRKIAKVRCLPNINNRKQTELGWVTVIIVPDSKEDQPRPSLELKRKVTRVLKSQCDYSLAFDKHIYVEGPTYVKVDVSVEIYVASMDIASEVERETKRKLNAFFHPLTGGPEGKGWEFGREVAVSDVYSVLETIEGVDHVENLVFKFNNASSREGVPVPRNSLVSSGDHSINLQLIDM